MAEDDQQERLNRELIELLNELRVALPGVQVLFAFLLGVPFTQRFAQATELQRDVFFFTFLTTAGATALLIAPSAYHRWTWRRHDKEHLLAVSNVLTLVGMALLALAISGAVFVVTDLLFNDTAAALIAGTTAVFYGIFWYVAPLVRRFRHSER